MSRPPYRQRFHVVEGNAEIDDPALHDGFDLLVGAFDDPHTVEAALALLAFGPKLVGVDWADVREAAGSGRGLAHVIPGVLNVAEDLEAARDDLSARSFGLGFLLVQLPESSDWLYTLQGLDDLTGRLFASVHAPVVFTAASGWLWSRSVLIGFGEDRRD